jgi:glyoxalase family protein
MEHQIKGLHHITAIARQPQPNYDFYTKVLGQRLVKKTVNFDDPTTYHLYYGNTPGEPGTLLTFFPWLHISRGIAGNGQASAVPYSIRPEAVDFWMERLKAAGLRIQGPQARFNETYISFTDPDGMPLELVASPYIPLLSPAIHPDIPPHYALGGFGGVTLSVSEYAPTAAILIEVFGYQLTGQEGNRYRLQTNASEGASLVDLVVQPGEYYGRLGAGSIHHVAFRVSTEEAQQYFQQKIASRGLDITSVIDRDYFHSVYFREPGGVLFEIATDPPGFTVDEPLEELGTSLKLPRQHQDRRAYLESLLPPIKQ